MVNIKFQGKITLLKLSTLWSNFPHSSAKPQMKKKCPKCKLVNFADVEFCVRCQAELSQIIDEKPPVSFASKILKRIAVFVVVCIFTLFGFYVSLIVSAAKLRYEESQAVEKAVALLDAKGFSREVFLLNYLTAKRSNDNWLNASVEKENAYAATNFPFEILTIYPDFFTIPIDDTERAAILLHEAQHLQGANEKQAYEFVWKHRRQLGWTKEKYEHSIIWRNVRKQTKEYSPDLFNCADKEYADCTEQ